MTKYFCDRCHNELSKPNLYAVTLENTYNIAVGNTKTQKYEICHECLQLIDLFIKQK